ncbi:proline-rich protein, partial [Mycena pura]
MWILTAEFDGQKEQEGPGVQKSKLLKTGKSYSLGRKDQPLCIKISKISHKHGEFTVGAFTQDDVTDPSTRPSLQYTNLRKDKIVPITRGEETHSVNPNATSELLDGDVLTVASRVDIRVQWHAICCYQQATVTKSVTLASCAALGIHISKKQVQNVTHHLTNTYAATAPHALSLVSASTFVKPEWLDEVLRLGNSSDGTSLEQTFTLPPIAKYRPAFNAALPSEQKTFKVWEPNEERPTMFTPFRFLCVGESKREIDSGLRELLTRAGAKVDVFDVSSGISKWRKALIRGKAKTNEELVLLAEEEACEAAVGKDSWRELVNEAQTFMLRFLTSRDIIQAILNMDTAKFNSSDFPDEHVPSSSPLPNIVPNTHAEEGSIIPAPEEPEPEPEPEQPAPRRLTRRAASLQPSQANPSNEEAPPPRKHLTRRAGIPIITGLDDPSILLNNLPDTSVVTPPAPEEPSVPKPRGRLKRRVGLSAAPEDAVDSLISNSLMSGVEAEPAEEPPLKKFKALFESIDPRNSGAQTDSGALDEDDSMSTPDAGSQTQTQTQHGNKRPGRTDNMPSSLRVVEEEEEESQAPIGAGPNELGKRKERSFDGDDVEMADVENALNSASGSNVGMGPAAKKRAVPANAVEHAAKGPPTGAQPAKAQAPTKLGKKGATASTGAATGKPDTDSVFLKAIASTKRGKKAEDDFDRDFNNLKITKTGLRADEVDNRPAWELLEDFGDETNLRGNFMVIQDLDVFKVATGGPRKRAVGSDPRWDGKPDFKKFKKQNTSVVRKTKIDLFISETNDTGLGPGYWKGGNSLPQSQEEDLSAVQMQPAKRATQASTKATQGQDRNQAMDIESDDMSLLQETRKRRKPPSKAEPPKKRTRGTKAPSDAAPALFLDSDSDTGSGFKMQEQEDMQLGGTLDDDDIDEGQTLKSSAEPTRKSTRMPAASKKKSAAIIVDDDSDDGAVFTGFGKKKGRK